MIGWVNIGILAGLAAIAIPVIVHLLRSRQFQVVELGTLRFLREAVEESARWRRLRDLLLLLLRLLAVALLTLLFARPFLTRTGSGSDRDQETVLLVDCSGSMAGRLLGGTGWDYARKRVDDLLNELPESGRVTVAAFADAVTEAPDWQEFEAEPGGATDYRCALRWAGDRLALSTARHRQVILVTDMQTAGLPAIRPAAWPDDVPVRLVPIPAAGAYNAGIAEVECTTPYPKGDAIVRVRVATSGDVPDRIAQMVLELDGQDPVRATVPLAAQTVDIPIPGKPGLKRGIVRLEAADEYPADNRRPFAFYLHNPAPVLLADGDPGSSPFEAQTYFLAKVLDTARNDAGRSAYAVTVARRPGSLSDYTAVALCNVPSFSHNEARDLAEFVNRGGALIVFLGDLCEPDAYKRLHRFNAFPLDFRPKRVPVPSPWIDWNAQHPALAAFGSRESGNLSRIVFRDAFEIKPDSDEQVLAHLASGMPALLVHSYGAGRVVVVTNPCTREWTNWPAERIFLPLIRELFTYATHGVGKTRSVVARSTGTSERREPGVYVMDDTIAVVAPSAAEIDIATCDEAAFRSALALPPPVGPDTDEQTAGLPEGRERKNEIWRWLAVALIAALLVENIIADRGRPG